MPVAVLAEMVGDVALPALSVVTVALDAKSRLAPLEGAPKVTDTFGTTLLYVSFTTVTKGAAKFAPSAADWPLPDTIAIVLAAPGVFVSANVVLKLVPEMVAVTLYVPAVCPALGVFDGEA